MRKLILTMLCVLLVLAPITSSQFVPDKPSQWYAIEPWEVAVCSKWGGRTQATETSSVETGLVGFGPFTYTMLGKKQVLLENNQTLYTYAYYLESYSAQLMYSIDLYNPETQFRKPLAGGNLGPGNGVVDQTAEYIDEEYTHLRLIHQFGTVMIPILEVGYE